MCRWSLTKKKREKIWDICVAATPPVFISIIISIGPLHVFLLSIEHHSSSHSFMPFTGCFIRTPWRFAKFTAQLMYLDTNKCLNRYKTHFSLNILMFKCFNTNWFKILFHSGTPYVLAYWSAESMFINENHSKLLHCKDKLYATGISS